MQSSASKAPKKANAAPKKATAAKGPYPAPGYGDKWVSARPLAPGFEVPKVKNDPNSEIHYLTRYGGVEYLCFSPTKVMTLFPKVRQIRYEEIRAALDEIGSTTAAGVRINEKDACTTIVRMNKIGAADLPAFLKEHATHVPQSGLFF